MARTVLQKLLSVDLSAAVVGRGFDQVGGIVVLAGDAVGLNTPAALLTAYGFGHDLDTDYVDVTRFEVPVCARVTAPSDGEARPWPTYPMGFLRPQGDVLVPVWELSWTRYSVGAEAWRIHRNGSQERISVYRGAALGWAGAHEWRPCSQLVGPRATWQGTEYVADVAEGQVTLTTFKDPESAEWEQRRYTAWCRVVPLSQCEVFEIVYTASLSGVRVRVVEVINGTACVQLVGSDPDAARLIGASMIDQGVFQNPRVPVGELSDSQVVANQLA